VHHSQNARPNFHNLTTEAEKFRGVNIAALSLLGLRHFVFIQTVRDISTVNKQVLRLSLVVTTSSAP